MNNLNLVERFAKQIYRLLNLLIINNQRRREPKTVVFENEQIHQNAVLDALMKEFEHIDIFIDLGGAEKSETPCAFYFGMFSHQLLEIVALDRKSVV